MWLLWSSPWHWALNLGWEEPIVTDWLIYHGASLYPGTQGQRDTQVNTVNLCQVFLGIHLSTSMKEKWMAGWAACLHWIFSLYGVLAALSAIFSRSCWSFFFSMLSLMLFLLLLMMIYCGQGSDSNSGPWLTNIYTVLLEISFTGLVEITWRVGTILRICCWPKDQYNNLFESRFYLLSRLMTSLYNVDKILPSLYTEEKYQLPKEVNINCNIT